MAAFSQRAPAAVRDTVSAPESGELAQVPIGEGIYAAMSVPVELDGSPKRAPPMGAFRSRQLTDGEGPQTTG